MRRHGHQYRFDLMPSDRLQALPARKRNPSDIGIWKGENLATEPIETESLGTFPEPGVQEYRPTRMRAPALRHGPYAQTLRIQGFRADDLHLARKFFEQRRIIDRIIDRPHGKHNGVPAEFWQVLCEFQGALHA